MPIDTIFSHDEKKQLFENRSKALELNIFEPNFKPVICLRAPKSGFTFLVTQLVPDDDRAVFCLSDYGNENVRLQVIDLNEVESKLALKDDHLVKDNSFVPKHTLAVYAKVADKTGRIVTDDSQEEYQPVFNQFMNNKNYLDCNKNLRRFRFDWVW